MAVRGMPSQDSLASVSWPVHDLDCCLAKAPFGALADPDQPTPTHPPTQFRNLFTKLIDPPPRLWALKPPPTPPSFSGTQRKQRSVLDFLLKGAQALPATSSVGSTVPFFAPKREDTEKCTKPTCPHPDLPSLTPPPCPESVQDSARLLPACYGHDWKGRGEAKG